MTGIAALTHSLVVQAAAPAPEAVFEHYANMAQAAPNMHSPPPNTCRPPSAN